MRYLHASSHLHPRRSTAPVRRWPWPAKSRCFVGSLSPCPQDNAFAYRHSTAFKAAVTQLRAEQRFIKPHCPWTNGKIERLNRTLATEWAYRQIFTSNQARQDALAPWLHHYNTERIHTGIGTTPIKRVSPTS
jgi:transposase InsO family protein